MGLTITLKPGVSSIRISGSYAFYRQIPFSEAKSHGIDVSKWDYMERTPNDLWQREEHVYLETIDFSENTLEYRNLEGNLQLQVYTHAIMDTGERVITIALINENQPESSNLLTASAFGAFQPTIHVAGVDEESIFTNVSMQT